MHRIIFLSFLFLSTETNAQFYNGSEQEFGKNRVQYFELDWRSQNYERFKIYFYRGEEEIAEYAAKTIHRELIRTEEFLNYSIREHLEILVFKSLTEMRQSNIGLTNENEAKYGGKTQIVGSKLFLYYDGNHADFQRQINEVIAETVLRNILFGEQWSDLLLGNDPNKHPVWFTKGFVDFISQPWDASFEAKVKDGFLTGRFDDFTRLSDEESRIAGHAFWWYIQETYGKSQLMTILYLTKMTGHIDRSLEYVLGSDLKMLLPSFGNYFKKRFLEDLRWQEDIAGENCPFRLKRNEKLANFTIDPTGQKLVFAANRFGRYRLVLYDFEKDKKRKLLAYEPKLPRIQDLGFPVFSFHPNGKFLASFLERKGKLEFILFDLEDKSTVRKEVPSLEKILAADYSSDGQTLVISGVKNGQTDLYIYKISGNSLDQLTDDLWDDLSPKWSLDGKDIYFASNRESDTLKKKEEVLPSNNTLDLFGFELKNKDKNKVVLTRLTSTPAVNENNPVEIKKDVFNYLSDENGLWNRWRLEKDSVIRFVDTIIHYRYNNKTFAIGNLNTSVLGYSFTSKEKVLVKTFQNSRYSLHWQTIQETQKKLAPTYFLRKQNQKNGPNLPDDEQVEQPEILSENDSIPVKIEISADGKYEKQTLVLYQDDDEYNNQSQSLQNQFKYEEPLRKKYKVNFAKDFVSAKVDNSFMAQSYQRYFGPGSVYLNPALSGLLRISFSDVMEDYVFSGGMRIPTSRNSSEFYTSLDLRRKRLDKQLFYYRRSFENRTESSFDKIITHETQLNLSYPFSEVFAWKSSAFSRLDVQHPLAVDEASLLRETRYFNQTGLKTALVFDNALQLSNNAWSGTRAKVFVEYLQTIENQGKGMLNIGLDLRHSIPIFKEMIWVNRFATATSVGGNRLLYYMGGVDNWMLRPEVNFNNETPVDPQGNFAYQTLATPMRGFVQNQRNGNSFFVFNSELRIPLLVVLSKTSVRNEPLRALQVVGFFDLGTAWTGRSPFSDDNFFNTKTIDNKPAVIKIINGQEPIIAAIGGGLRTELFGYFIRGDLGWGIENREVLKRPRLFLTLSKDI